MSVVIFFMCWRAGAASFWFYKKKLDSRPRFQQIRPLCFTWKILKLDLVLLGNSTSLTVNEYKKLASLRLLLLISFFFFFYGLRRGL
jgi:hypothetical protein